MSAPCFQFQDFHDQLPAPGFYPSSVKSARFRRSTNGNRMLEVVHAVEGVEPAYQLLADYFVLEGAAVSPTGIFLARRRLVQLYRACRLFPEEGDQIDPAQLLNARLQIDLQHQEWQGRLRLRVVGYRPLPADPQMPFRV